ncbi:MAG: DUF434 domain-containing protein [Planctomycetaceae bacterium]|nr:DUF434 domain-containing protein [Planctomycetaceae bacterium]
MPDHRRHRGPHPDDQTLFAECQLPALRDATTDLSWLLSKEYALKSSLKLVGDRYALDGRQRTAVSRCACTDLERQQRNDSQLDPRELSGATLWIDGYNVLTSIEAALSGGVILKGRDGCFRDMASMHGSYRKVSETIPALEMLGEVLTEMKVAHCRWLFDQPVSNSGRLKTLLAEMAEERGWDWEIELVSDPDPLLASSPEIVATADSEILNQADRWFDLARTCIAGRIPAAWVIDLSD